MMPMPCIKYIKIRHMEIKRIRIVEKDGRFFFERKVRKEWIPVLAENGEPLTALTRDLAERMLNEYDF